jgi:hypothetical protein
MLTKYDYSRFLMMRSNSLPIVLRRRMDRYDDGCSNGLSPFRRRTNFAIFHVLGKDPYLKHRLNILLKIFDFLAVISFTTMSGIPSRPNGILQLTYITSAMVTSGKNCSKILGGHFISFTEETKTFTMDSSMSGSVNPRIVFLSISFLVTILYGNFHESVST